MTWVKNGFDQTEMIWITPFKTLALIPFVEEVRLQSLAYYISRRTRQPGESLMKHEGGRAEATSLVRLLGFDSGFGGY